MFYSSVMFFLIIIPSSLMLWQSKLECLFLSANKALFAYKAKAQG